MIRRMRNIANESWANWQQFWFTPSDPLPLGILRLALGAMLLYTHSVWSLDLLGFFGESGWNNEGVLASLQEDTVAWSLWWWVPTGAEYHFHIGCLIVLFLFWIGLATRVTSVLAWIITVSYAHRSMLSSFGADQINAMLAFYLMLSPCGARFSIDRLLTKKRVLASRNASATLALRLIQVHVCVIYIWAGLSKLQGSSWWTGDALWHVVSNYEYQTLDLTWLANYPTVLQLATHGVLLFELTFPILVFRRRLKPLALVLGILVHVSIGACLGMWTFGLIMICTYVSFVDADAIRRASTAMLATFGRKQATAKRNDMSILPDAVQEKEPAAYPESEEYEPAVTPQAPMPDLPPPVTSPPITVQHLPATVKIAEHLPEPSGEDSSNRRRQRYVTDKLLYVARSQQQRANVRAYFRRHAVECCVLRGAAELIEETVNLRKATIVLRAKDFSRAELQFWFEELIETNPAGQFRVFLLPNAKQPKATEGLEVPAQIRLFRLSATTTLRRIRKLYVSQDWGVLPSSTHDTSNQRAQSGTSYAAKTVCWFLVILLLGCGAKRDTPKVQMERARMMLDRGQLHESVQAFTAALTAGNGNANDYYDRGVAYERLQQLEQAAADYTEALRLAPMHAQALNNRAVILAQLGRVEEAEVDLSQAIEINPNDALAWSNRGLARHESGAFADAISDYSQALQLNEEPRLFFQRGNALADNKQPEQAIADFTSALDLDDSLVRAYLNRANALVQLGRLDEAVVDLQTANKMDHELTIAGSIQQLQSQIRGKRWKQTAVSGMQEWLKKAGYSIRPAADEALADYVLYSAQDESANGMPCLITPTGPRGAPVFDASVSEELLEYGDCVALIVIDKEQLIRGAQDAASSQPEWLKDWRFDWKPLASDFVTSQVEVLLGPAAE